MTTEADKARYRAWYQKNRARCQARARAYAAAHAKERKAYRKKYYAANAPEFRRRARAWAVANPEQRRQTARRWLGLPEPTRPCPERCELCGCKPKGVLHLDHDHVTKAFRGWICWHCNTGLGKLGDTIAGLQRAVRYLRKV